MPFFIAARAVSGMGAGGMTGLSFIIVADSFPLGNSQTSIERTVRSTQVFTKELTWRWCFWINLPIVGFTFLMLLFFYHDQGGNRKSTTTTSQRVRNSFGAVIRIDWVGSALFASAITCFVLPISLGGDYWPWTSPQTPVLLVVSVVSLVGFISNEIVIEQDKALIPVRMMKNGSLLAAWTNLLLPVWFQVVQNRNPTTTGLLLLPYLFGLVIVGIIYPFLLQIAGSILCAMSMNKGNRKRVILVTGAILFLVGIVLISALMHKLPLGALIAVLLVFGAGSGLVLQTSFIEAQAAVAPDDVAVTNSLAVVFEYLGGAIGLTISSTINRVSLAHRTASIPTTLVVGQSPTLASLLFLPSDVLHEILQNPYLANDLPNKAGREAVRNAFGESLLLTLKALTGFAAGVLVVSVLFVGRRKGKRTDEDEEFYNN
ncbi:MAG: hypothetical protein Q9182_004972 [Xanthomendoza sp. 2 TL-2023]